MRIALDTSVLNRPFDDQTQARIALETQSLRVILQLIETQAIQLISSAVALYENSRNRSSSRQQWVQQCLNLASAFQDIDADVTQRAVTLEEQGVKPLDALHVACAEVAGCDYFLTCDDRLIRRYAAWSKDSPLRVANPVSFVLEITGDRG